MKTTLFSSLIGDINVNLAFTNNLEATTDPSTGNDSSQGYQAGSTWVNTSAKRAFTCVSAAVGAAQWNESGSSGTPGQVIAPNASTATGAGGAALIAGGTGGATSGAGGASSNQGGAATAGNSAGGAADTTGGAGSGSSAGGVGKVVGGAGGATGAGGAAQVTGGAGGATSGAGGAAAVAGGAATAGNSAGGAASLIAGASTGTTAGPATTVTGGLGGTGTGGNGGNVPITGGAAGTGSNGNGGDLVLAGGALDGTGAGGNIVERTTKLVHQGTPTAATTSATLTAAQLLAGIITVNQGGAATSTLTLPLQSAMDTALPNAIANDAFDFSVINISTVAAENCVIAANSWTTVGDLDIAANSAITTKSAGRFRARKTGTGAWTLYRLS